MTRSQKLTIEQVANPSQDQVNGLISLYNSGQMERSLEICRKLLQTYPKSLFLLGILGSTLLKQEKLMETVDVYDRMIQLKPDYAEIYSNRGVVLMKLGRLTE